MPYNKESYEECGTRALCDRIDKCIMEARNASRILPRIRANGSSDCPFADKLYEKAYAWRDELKEQLRQLSEHATGAGAAMERARQAEERAIWNSDPRDDGKQERAEYELHRAARERIQRKLSESRRALREIEAEIESGRES